VFEAPDPTVELVWANARGADAIKADAATPAIKALVIGISKLSRPVLQTVVVGRKRNGEFLALFPTQA